MRRLVAFVLLFVMAFSLSVAESTTTPEKKEITFQGIPWGSNVKDAVSALEKAGYALETAKFNVGSGNILKKDDTKLSFMVEWVDCVGSITSETKETTKIAGHEVSLIALSFFLDSNDPTNSDLARLFLAYVYFDTPDKWGWIVRDDLARKLEHLYGPGGDNGRALIFNGGDDTAIYLFGSSSGVRLVYYKTNSIDVIENYISYGITPEMAEDYSGL